MLGELCVVCREGIPRLSQKSVASALQRSFAAMEKLNAAKERKLEAEKYDHPVSLAFVVPLLPPRRRTVGRRRL